METAFRYTVLSGDTLSAIAAGISASAGVTYQAIESANPDISATGLEVGMVINIPAKDSNSIVLRYTVMAGDTYSNVAEQLSLCPGITYRQIAADNPGMNPDMVSIGQVINIPATKDVPVIPVSKPDHSQVAKAEQIGFWRWTWSPDFHPPAGCNMGLSFSGWTDSAKALEDSSNVYASVPDLKYITLGGGNKSGAFTEAALQEITNSIQTGKFSSYTGIAFDVEEGDSGLSASFTNAFKAAKEKGLNILVTISHSAPYGISDAHTLMTAFLSDPNIDFLSPQLYTTGKETQNQYDTSGGVTWKMYTDTKAKVIPSIVRSNMYEDAVAYFSGQGVTLSGFVQWSQA